MAWYSGLVLPRLSTAPWSFQHEVARWYYEDLSWLYKHYDQGEVFVGSRAKRPVGKGVGREKELYNALEKTWVETSPPVKDKRGIPIPEDRKYYRGGGTPAEYMVINGRKMRWDGEKYVPMPIVRITTPRWKRSKVPVDTKLFHGPHLPKARVQAHALTERMLSVQGPTISLDLSDATVQESVDLLDLLEAINE